MKSNARITLDKCKSGGKKKGGKKGKQEQPAEEKPIESCAVFVAKEYPDWQKQVINVLIQYFADKEEGKEAVDFIKTIKDQIKGPKCGLALKFAAFMAKETETQGKEALKLEAPFDEQQLIESNKVFIFENMNAIKNVRVVVDEAPEDIPNSANHKENATPLKPVLTFY